MRDTRATRTTARTPAAGLAVRTLCHPVHLYTRPHIDLKRVAGALCRL